MKKFLVYVINDWILPTVIFPFTANTPPIIDTKTYMLAFFTKRERIRLSGIRD